MSTSVRAAALKVETLPNQIEFIDRTPVEQKVGWCWSIVLYPLQLIGVALRNALYLPLYSLKTREANKHELDLAREFAYKVKDTAVPIHSTRKIDAIREHFSIRDVGVSIVQGNTKRTFWVRLFESKAAMLGKKIQFILFSFYHNEEKVPGHIDRKWEPLSMKELSKAPLDVLRALKASGVEVDAMLTQSLGNVAHEGLQYLSKEDEEVIPKTLIINRGLASIWKVSQQLFSFPISWILYGAAKVSSWDADPERGLMDFLRRRPQCSDGTLREMVIIEAIKDHFYAGPGAFDPNFHQDIRDLGLRVFRGKFFPGTVHPRAHHAISMSKLTHNSAAEILGDEDVLNLEREQKLSSALARKIFAEKGDHYTCFYVGGNGSTLDVGTWDVCLFLGSLIKESQKTPVRE
ncbi:MAG TPA: hypothetical protein VIJ14_07335 [Rhabdochlamydiaceae bacterium]